MSDQVKTYKMFYLVKQPKWFSSFCHNCIWDLPTEEKVLYLTFDDGPHPVHTVFVLDELKKYNAKATFFCIGKNVVANPQVYSRILEEGHAVGNHTWEHKDGWKTRNKEYYGDIIKAKEVIDSKLYRPPYGHITPFQVKRLRQQEGLKTILWSIISGDFDTGITPAKCFNNVAVNAYPGSIVLMHDSEKASEKVQYVLPRLLELFSEKGYVFKSIQVSELSGVN